MTKAALNATIDMIFEISTLSLLKIDPLQCLTIFDILADEMHTYLGSKIKTKGQRAF